MLVVEDEASILDMTRIMLEAFGYQALTASTPGEAIRLARDGNADVLLVHDPAAEERLVAEGFGLARLMVMHNDFLLIGPAGDPAQAKGRPVAAASGAEGS